MAWAARIVRVCSKLLTMDNKDSTQPTVRLMLTVTHQGKHRSDASNCFVETYMVGVRATCTDIVHSGDSVR